jgi:hypothetical protein
MIEKIPENWLEFQTFVLTKPKNLEEVNWILGREIEKYGIDNIPEIRLNCIILGFAKFVGYW